MITDDLRQRRLAIIREHMDTEVTKEFDATLATFNGHPHYEIMATGQTYDGDDEVMGYYLTTRTAFPDQRHDNARFHVADDAVIVEFDLLGTNLGEFYGLPPTGKAFRVPLIAVFFFDGDRIINERIYFDTASLVTQIGRGELLAWPGTSMAESSLPRTQEQRRIEAERRLVRAAAELVGEIGPGKVTLAKVGERAGYSRGLATHHFGSKGALMQRLVDAVTSQFRDAIAEESQSDSPIDQLRQLIDFYFRVVSDLQPVNRARLVLWADAVAGSSEDVRPRMVSADREFREEIEKRIELAVTAGEVASSVDPQWPGDGDHRDAARGSAATRAGRPSRPRRGAPRGRAPADVASWIAALT